jgi:hypothetical protein
LSQVPAARALCPAQLQVAAPSLAQAHRTRQHRHQQDRHQHKRHAALAASQARLVPVERHGSYHSLHLEPSCL